MKNLLITKTLTKYLFLVVCLASCTRVKETKSVQVLKEEIVQTEKAFERMAREKGISEAFYFYADKNAVIKRAHDTLIQGNENIRNFYSNPVFQHATVTWAPDFTEVSSDGTLAYTFGRYRWKEPGKDGKIEEFKGVFHTVWKKQTDGSWKYVWD